MAAYRDIGATVFSANSVANPTTLSPAKPATAVNGDLLVILTSSRSITATVTTPAGWTLLTGFPFRSGTASGGTIYAFARVADGSASDSPSISWSGVTTGTNGDSCAATMLAAHTVDTSNLATVIDGTASANDAASTTSITLPSITTTVDRSLIIGHAIRINDTAHTFTGGRANERRDTHTTTGTGHGTQITDVVQTAAGSAGTATVTPSNTTSSRTLAVTFALKNAKISTFTDNFEDGTISATDWTRYIGTESESAGVLHLPSSAAVQTGIFSVRNFDLTGDAAYVEMLQVPLQTGSETGFFLRVDANNMVGIYVGGATLVSYRKVAGVGGFVNTAYDPAAHRWLRIREAGGTTFWETSPGGSTWTTQRSEANPITLTSLRVDLSNYFDSGTPVEAQFDNFNVAVVVKPRPPMIRSQAVMRAANW